MQIENGVIERTSLGTEDHGIMTCMLHIRFKVCEQSFGGFTLDSKSESPGNHRTGTAYGMEFIMRILDVVYVPMWEDLCGKHLRVKRNDECEDIVAIGNIVKDKWFNPREDLASFLLAVRTVRSQHEDQ